MEIKKKWEKLTQKEKDYIARKIGMAVINKKIKAAEQAEEMAKTFEETTGQKPTRKCIEMVKEFLSL